MNGTLTAIILGASVILEVVLELKGIRVPDVVLVISGFAVRHIIGGDTAKNTAIVPEIPIVAPKTAIPEPTEVKV